MGEGTGRRAKGKAIASQAGWVDLLHLVDLFILVFRMRMLFVHAVSALWVLESPEEVFSPDLFSDIVDVGNENQPEVENQADSHFHIYNPSNVSFC